MHCDCLLRPVHWPQYSSDGNLSVKYRETLTTGVPRLPVLEQPDRRIKVPRIRTPLVASPVGRSAPDGKFSSGFRYAKSPVLVQILEMASGGDFEVRVVKFTTTIVF